MGTLGIECVFEASRIYFHNLIWDANWTSKGLYQGEVVNNSLYKNSFPSGDSHLNQVNFFFFFLLQESGKHSLSTARSSTYVLYWLLSKTHLLTLLPWPLYFPQFMNTSSDPVRSRPLLPTYPQQKTKLGTVVIYKPFTVCLLHTWDSNLLSSQLAVITAWRSQLSLYKYGHNIPRCDVPYDASLLVGM